MDKQALTLPPALWAELKAVRIQRKSNGEQDYDVSSLIGEALTEWLRGLKGNVVHLRINHRTG